MKILGLVASIVFLSTAVFAQDNIKDRYWPILLTGDIATIEKALDQLDEEVRAGRASYDDQRSVYNLLEVSHPAIHDLLERWLKQDPESRHALAGKMWQLRWIAQYHRGGDAARWVHPEAARENRENLAAAHVIALELLEKYPDFVPGTDGILRQMNNYGGRANADAYLGKILALTPNVGSLHRGVWGHQPRWGGSYFEMVRLCRKYAPLIKEPEGYNADICIADTIVDFNVTSPKYLKLAQDAIDKYGDQISWTARFWDAVKYRVDPDRALTAFEERRFPDGDKARRLLFVLSNTNPELGAHLFEKDKAEELEYELGYHDYDPYRPKLIAKKITLYQQPLWDFQSNTQERKMKLAAEMGLPMDRQWTEEEVKKLLPHLTDEAVQREKLEAEIGKKVLPLLRDLDRYGQFSAEAWKTRTYNMRYFRNYENDGFRRGMERSFAIYSNFKVENAKTYVGNLRSTREAFDRMSKNGENMYFGHEIDPAEKRDNLDCELVVATRMVIQSCARDPRQRLCANMNQWYKNPWEILEEAKRAGLCTSMAYAPEFLLRLPPPLTLEDLQ